MFDSQKINCVVMRGGTSKAVFFHEKDLPKEPAEQDEAILQIFGSPDIRQIDGLGGANSSTSKVAIIGLSERPDADINYTFGQVSLDSPYIGKKMNCGNISAAVGPFAIEEGLVKAEEPTTVVRIFNTNTNKIIVSHVPVQNGKPVYKGEFKVDGVPGTGARIDLEFNDPGGAVSGKLLPTDKPRQTIKVEGKTYNVSIVDAANPLVFVDAKEVGLMGTELPWEFESRPDAKQISAIFESIRGQAAQMIGLVDDHSKAAEKSPELPKVGFYAAPIDYTDATGKEITANEYDLAGRLFSMGKMIHAYMGTGTICTTVAANIPGTVVNEIVRERLGEKITEFRIGHPFGIITANAKVDENGVKSCTIGRTARRIMEGQAYLRE